MCLSVRGALNGGKQKLKSWVNCITVDGKTLATVDEVREFLYDQLSQGHEVIPLADCDNFDYKNGCLGRVHADAPRD
jgi:hypothetical protein